MQPRRLMALGSAACLAMGASTVMAHGSRYALAWWLGGIAWGMVAVVLFITAARR